MKRKFKLPVYLLFINMMFSCQTNPSIQVQLDRFEVEMDSIDARWQAIPNDSLKNLMSAYLFPVTMHMGNTYDKMVKPEIAEYVMPPSYIMTGYDSEHEMAENYIKGFLPVLKIDNRNNETHIKLKKPYKYPREFPYIIEQRWEKVAFDNGDTVSVIKKNWDAVVEGDKMRVVEQLNYFPKQLKLFYGNNNQHPLPVSVLSTATVKIPNEIKRLVFIPDEVGVTKEAANYTVQLKSLTESDADIEILLPDIVPDSVCLDQFKWINVLAVDKQGRYLKAIKRSGFNTNEHAEIYKEYYQMLVDQKEYTPDFIHSITSSMKAVFDSLKAINKEQQARWYHAAKFAGDIDKVIVEVADYTNCCEMRMPMEYPISKIKSYYQQGSVVALPANALIYDIQFEHLLSKPFELKEEELTDAIQIAQRLAHYDKNPSIRLKYPDLLSSKLESGVANRFDKLVDITFYNKDHQPIAISPDSIGWSSTTEMEKLVDFTFGRIDYHPERFPEKPFFAKGIVDVNLLYVNKESYSKDKLPQGLTIDGNMLVVNESLISLMNKELHVKDDLDNYLELMYKSTIAGDFLKKIPTQKVYYFYGQPAVVEIFEAEKNKEVEFSFDIELNQQQRASKFFRY